MIFYFYMLLKIKNNNIKMVKLLINYATKNNIILDVNKEKKCSGCSAIYAILYALSHDNIDMVKLLLEYAKKIIFL